MNLSLRKYAQHRKQKGLTGGSLRGVQKAIQSGRIRTEPDGTINPERADADWLERTSVTKSRSMTRERRQEEFREPQHTAAGNNRSFFEAQRQREWIRVQKDQLELDLRQQRVVELAPINAWGAGMVIKARQELLRIAPELRDRLAQEADPIACEGLIAKRVQAVLEALADAQTRNRQGDQNMKPRHTADIKPGDLKLSEDVALAELEADETDVLKKPAKKKATTKNHKGKSR